MSTWGYNKKSILVLLIWTLLSIAGAGGAWAGIWFSSPANGSTVSGTVTITMNPDSGTSWSNWYLDGVYEGSTPPRSFSWDTRSASNGTHHLTATAFASNGSTLGSGSSTVTVANGSSGSGSSTPTPNSSLMPTGQPTPPPLVNAQNPINFGADPTGVVDSTLAFQAALNAGDLQVTAGYYLISGHLYWPTRGNVHMQCDLGSNNRLAAFLQNPSTSAWQMIDIYSGSNSSIFNCGFRGPNADINGVPSDTGANQPYFIRVNGPNNTNTQIVGNDFNGIGGAVGAINVYSNPSQFPSPDRFRIAYNSFEHCGYYAVQLGTGTNGLIDHNTLNDCSGFVEGNITNPPSPVTGNIIDSNHLTFTYGIGAAMPNCVSVQGWCGWNYLTGGASASGGAFNYSGNTVQNNIVDGTHSSFICINAVGGTQDNAIYINNTCTGGCALY